MELGEMDLNKMLKNAP